MFSVVEATALAIAMAVVKQMDGLEEIREWSENTDGGTQGAFRKAVAEIERLRAENADLQRKAGVDRFSGSPDQFAEHMKGKTGE